MTISSHGGIFLNTAIRKRFVSGMPVHFFPAAENGCYLSGKTGRDFPNRESPGAGCFWFSAAFFIRALSAFPPLNVSSD
jgi:hypothetical protein